MNHLFDVPRGVREQALYTSFLNMVPGLLMAGARSSDPSQAARGYGMAVQGFGQGGQDYMNNWRNMQALGFATRKSQREEEAAARRKRYIEGLPESERPLAELGPEQYVTGKMRPPLAPRAPPSTVTTSEGIFARNYDGTLGQKLGDAPVRGPLATVTTPPSETAFSKEVGEGVGKRFNELRAAAGRAQKVDNQLGAFETLLNEMPQDTGAGRPWLTRASSFMQSVGLDPTAIGLDKAGGAEAARALSSQMVLQALGSLGTGISNADRDMIMDSMPNIGMTPEANRIAVQMIRRLNQRTKEMAREASRYRAASPGADPLAIEDHVEAMFDDRDVFDEKFRTEIKTILGKASKAPPQGGAAVIEYDAQGRRITR